MRLKILENEYQSHLDHYWFKRRTSGRDVDDDSVLDPIVGHGNRIDPVYNRVGFYLQGDGKCWLEFQIESGRFVGIEYGAKTFQWKLDGIIANENSIPDEEWVMVQHLIKKGVIDNERRFTLEGYRRAFRKSSLESRKRIIDMKKRIAEKVKESKH